MFRYNPSIRPARRDLLIAASAAASSAIMPGCIVRPEAATRQQARDVVLVHGAWHGGWCWDQVTTILQDAGLRVHAMTLPGLGDRADELGPEIGLDTHISDAISFIHERDLDQFLLCGHSYGGMVITGIADAMEKRIAHVVYLDAALPRDGDSMISYGEPRPAQAIAAAEQALRGLAPDGIAMMPLPPSLLGIPEDHPLHDWVAERLTPHPLKTWLDPIRLPNGGASNLPRTYVHCINPVLAQTQFPYIARMAASDGDWRYAELQTGHDAMITDPDGVAGLLIESAKIVRES